MSSSSNRRRGDLSPSRGGVGSSKLRMDRQPVVARITDPSLTIGKRKEIDNVMKKARASTNEYWDKKLLEAEEKDPNRWRHTGYKKMYIEGESSSESEREFFRYNRNRSSRSRSPRVARKSPPPSPLRRRSPPPLSNDRRRSPPSPALAIRRRSPRSPDAPPPRSRQRSPPPEQLRRRPRSPPEPPLRRKSPRSPRSPVDSRRRTPPSPVLRNNRRSPPPPQQLKQRPAAILPRSKRPPSPPPKRHNFQGARTPSNSSLSSCSDDSCSVCSPKPKRARSRSVSNPVPRSRHGPRSPPPKNSGHTRPISSSHPSVAGGGGGGSSSSMHAKRAPIPPHHTNSSAGGRAVRPTSPPHIRGGPIVDEKQQTKLPPIKHRIEEKILYQTEKVSSQRPTDRAAARHLIDDPDAGAAGSKHVLSSTRSARARVDVPEDPRLKVRPPEPPGPAPQPKKSKDKSAEKFRAKVKIEGEKRKKNETSESDDSDSSENSLPTFTATTRLTLSERFGKMAQWSVDRSNMENMNMRITKDSTGGALKVMIEEGLESPPRRYSYSPAPVGHFPEELSATAPTGLMSWDDVRVRYEYYKSRGYLRDLDLKDYVKWEEWWYRYQEWLKQERYYELYERQQMHRRRRKKIPISQRLN